MTKRRLSTRPKALTVRHDGAESKVRPLVVDYPDDVQRPRTRGDCENGPRPCPWVSCRHHLALDVSKGGHLKLNFPHLEPDEIEESCSLDVADRGGASLDEVAEHVNVVRERARQMINAATARARKRGGRELQIYREERSA